MRFAVTRFLLVSWTAFSYSVSTAIADWRPINRSGFEFNVEYAEFADVTAVYSRVGSLLLFYGYGGPPDDPQPCPGWFTLDDDDPNSTPSLVRFRLTDTKVIEAIADPYLIMSESDLRQIVESTRVTIEINWRPENHRQPFKHTLTDEDFGNLRKLADFGKSWKPTTDLVRLRGDTGIVVVGSDRLHQHQNAVKTYLIEWISTPPAGPAAFWIVFDTPAEKQGKTMISLWRQDEKDRARATERVQREMVDLRKSTKSKLGEIIDKLGWGGARQVVLLVGEDVDLTADELAAMASEAAEDGIRLFGVIFGNNPKSVEKIEKELGRHIVKTHGAIHKVLVAE